MSTHTAGSNNPIDNDAEIAELIDIEADSIEDVALEDIWIAGIPLGKLLSKALQNSSEAKEMAEQAETEDSPSNPEGMDGEEGEVAASQIAQTPLERTTVLPEQFCDYVNDQRARHLAMDLKQYARSAKSGYVLEPSDIADVLYSREQDPTAAHDETVSRVREILADSGGEEVEIIDRGRQKIVHFTDEIAERLTNLGKLRDRCPSLVSSDVCDDDSGVRG